ncbi:glycosyl hydrolase, partial [Pelomonas sp. KK5]|uniref:glycosyl hydrolase n=1 Tax=Pelomonas sp. KK5 TaxID=1855730 RepID=UPI0021009673
MSRWLLLILCLCAGTACAGEDPLWAGFTSPPQSARPRVWWHWMNGNVSPDGIRQDLEWMQRVGIGGFQLFEASMGTPVVVPQRQVFGSPQWHESIRLSAETAQRLGLEMAVAASPGWSATGGPWVKPEDAMRKLVWSETRLRGGVRFRGRLAEPPSAAGPYQDVGERGTFRQEVALLAYPASPGDRPLVPRDASSPQGAVQPASLIDGLYADAITLPEPDDGRGSWVTYRFSSPQTVRSVTVGLLGSHGFGAPTPPLATLQSSHDGRTFTDVALLPATGSPVRTASFAPVRAAWFRLRIERPAVKGLAESARFAPGALPLKLPPAPRGFALSEFVLRGEGRVHAGEEKAGFATVPDYNA